MSRRRSNSSTGALLDLWRPPAGAGEPVGCLTSTYTFHPGLFDEQCLARFFSIESEPNREDLAFLLEREDRLGATYAGVLVDHTQAGVEHSYRWDVLPVRIRGAKQHAKLSVLVWHEHVRVIVTSANLTEPGYRTNFEVAVPVDLSPNGGNKELLADALTFLKELLDRVPGTANAAVVRGRDFVADVERRTRRWEGLASREATRQHLVCSLSPRSNRGTGRSALGEAVALCRGKGGSPNTAWVASPFFDGDDAASSAMSALVKTMGRGAKRRLRLCVPGQRDDASKAWRLLAPKSLLEAAKKHDVATAVEALPALDEDMNPRAWHAKLMALQGGSYTAMMVGSSNFTVAGLGLDGRANAEANVLTVVRHESFGRQAGQLEAMWPETTVMPNPDAVEWRGALPDEDEEERASGLVPLHEAFLAATYRASEPRAVIMTLDPAKLPAVWSLSTAGREVIELLGSDAWRRDGAKPTVEVSWNLHSPPEKLLVRWDGHEALMPLNVEDRAALPPPPQFLSMNSDDMLGILAAVDPSAAYRTLARRLAEGQSDEEDLDAAVPIDLDPLRRYDLHATFLHRVRRRARVLAQLRANVERPVFGRQALEWRLRGLVGIQALADRLASEVVASAASTSETLLTLADFLIVLGEVQYQPTPTALNKDAFDEVFVAFLRTLSRKLHHDLESQRERVSAETWQFWEQVVRRVPA
jgi:hypothetical protein